MPVMPNEKDDKNNKNNGVDSRKKQTNINEPN